MIFEKAVEGVVGDKVVPKKHDFAHNIQNWLPLHVALPLVHTKDVEMSFRLNCPAVEVTYLCCFRAIHDGFTVLGVYQQSM